MNGAAIDQRRRSVDMNDARRGFDQINSIWMMFSASLQHLTSRTGSTSCSHRPMGRLEMIINTRTEAGDEENDLYEVLDLKFGDDDDAQYAN